MKSAPFGRLRMLLVTVFAVVMAVVWGAIAYQIKITRDEALSSARQHGDNLTSTAAAHFSSFVRTIDLLLQQLRIEWTHDHPPESPKWRRS